MKAGGWIPGTGTIMVTLEPEECIVKFADDRPVCVRDHDTHDPLFWAQYPQEWRP